MYTYIYRVVHSSLTLVKIKNTKREEKEQRKKKENKEEEKRKGN